MATPTLGDDKPKEDVVSSDSNDEKSIIKSTNTPTPPSQDGTETRPSSSPKEQLEGAKTSPDDDDEPETVYVTGWKLASLLAAITLACFLVLLDMSIIVTAIPRITTQFHSLPDVGWYAGAYQLANAACQPLAGKLYTYFKARWMFLSFLLIFEIGSVVCGVANSSTVLIIGRAIAGIGGSGLINGALTIISHATPLEKRPSLIGMAMGGSQLGIVFGPLLGGVFTEFTTWRWCFYVNLPVGGVAAVILLFVSIPDRRIRPEGSLLQTVLSKLDLTGFAIFSPSIVMLLLALQFGGNDYAWDSATVIGLFVGSAVTFAIFLFWEHRVGDEAMIPFSVVAKREIWMACLYQMFQFVPILIASFYLPIYFQSIKGATPFESGVDVLPSILTNLVFGVLSGFLTQKVGYYLPFGVASGVVIAIGNGLLSTLDIHTSTAKWAGYQALVGFGRGIGLQMAFIAAQANAKPSMVAIATALLVFCQTLSGAVFLVVANSIFNNVLRQELESRVPALDAQLIIDAGATGIKQVVVNARDMRGVLESYVVGVQSTFYVAVAGSAGVFFAAWGMGWVDIRKKKPQTAGDA